MAVVWTREMQRERSQSGKYGETYVYKRSWLVRVDDPSTPLPDITNGPGINWLDPHPDDDSCLALEFDTKPADDTGLLYIRTCTYQKKPPNSTGGDEEADQPTYVEGIMKIPIWSGGSSVTSGPATRDKDGDVIANSAGDPLEDLSMDVAEFRLTLTQYYASHTQWGPLAREYTNAVNSDSWNGGTARTWKCQGCSAQVQTENNALVTITFWEVTWEFAYREDDWNLKAWDVGFHELCGSDGVASASGDKRKAIKGQDGKTSKQPVALGSGVALPAGMAPQIINNGNGAEVYRPLPFASVFGELYTPILPA